MKRLLYELTESFRIAFAQIRANKLRSVLTALGVIIGIVAVTLMGTAIRGIDTGFTKSLAMLGDDVLYVQKWPWGGVEDWWNYANRPPIRPEDADKINRIIEQTPNSLLEVAVPVSARGNSVKAGENKVSGVFTIGTTADYGRLISADFSEGRRRSTRLRVGLRRRRSALSKPLLHRSDRHDRRASVYGHRCRRQTRLFSRSLFLR